MARRPSDGRTLYLALCIVVATTTTASDATDYRWRIDDGDLVPEVLASADWRLLYRHDVALSADSEDGGGSSMAVVADLRFDTAGI